MKKEGRVMVVRRGWKFRCIIYMILMTFVLGGCASKYGAQITNVKYYPECYQPIQDLRNAEKQFNTTVAGSVVAGALIGAMVGALATGKVQGAVVGAAAGGLAGGLAGYALAKQRQIKDDNARMASYLQDLDGDISGLDRVSAAAQMARKCYDRQFQLAVEMFKDKKITRAELDERYQEIQNGSLEASKILGNVISGAGTKEAEYQEALKSEAQLAKRDIPEPVLAPPPPAPETIAPEPEKPKKTKHTKVSKKKHKKVKEEEEAKPAPAPVAAQTPKKTPVVETGDKLVDMSTRKAKLNESIQDAKKEKEQLDQAQAERKKTLDQLMG